VGFALSLLVLGVWSLRIVLLVSEGSSTV